MLHVLKHPLASHLMTHLRDKTTKPATFRTLCYQLSLLLAIEATRDLRTEEKVVETPSKASSARYCRIKASSSFRSCGRAWAWFSRFSISSPT